MINTNKISDAFKRRYRYTYKVDGVEHEGIAAQDAIDDVGRLLGCIAALNNHILNLEAQYVRR